MQENWFENWFDSPYYHLLYNHRNYQEAEFFINNLMNFLALSKNAKVLDLACGKGRHSLQIHNLGYQVVGVDLSPESIEAANKLAEKGLDFKVGDMRDIAFQNHFDLVVNLFTSFGYFREEGENVKVIKSISESLKPNGILVLDYLNVAKAEQNLPTNELIKREKLDFKVQKAVRESFIVKDIEFAVKDKIYHFNEYVKRFGLSDFEAIFETCGLEICNVFGNYALESFDAKNSDRLILVAKKK